MITFNEKGKKCIKSFVSYAMNKKIVAKPNEQSTSTNLFTCESLLEEKRKKSYKLFLLFYLDRKSNDNSVVPFS